MSSLISPPMTENHQFREFIAAWESQTRKNADLEIDTQGKILKGKLKRRLYRQMHAYIRRNSEKLREFRRGHVEVSRDPSSMLTCSNMETEIIQARSTVTMKRFIKNAGQEADLAIESCKKQMHTQIKEVSGMLVHMASLDMEMSRQGAIQNTSTPVQILEDIVENIQVREERGLEMPKEAVLQGVESLTKEANLQLLKWQRDRFEGWTDRVYKSGRMKDMMLSKKFIQGQLGPYMEGIEERMLAFFQNCTMLDMEATGKVMHFSWSMIQRGLMGKGAPMGRTLRPRK
ncbi:protein EE1A [Proboscivirus elephantidbeta5]|uniref:Protein EE1A n=1 Tax=Elephant endotheliotropic herpesvirus 5 TaxID=768738 RepID=A0A075CYB3_9BETA|nr:protein EE1A [Elephant endotheliotropic herpesvirus 5]AHC02760.1 protein EE1A [Elephant endotheliotropic herpesvirus 5]